MLRVPLAPHHSMIYGAALHAAVAEFHRRHARGEVMSEDDLYASFVAAWQSEGFLSREHEEARLEAGRASLRRFREEQLADGAVQPAFVEREFSFLLGGDRVRGRFDRVDIVPRDDEPATTREASGGDAAADVVSPTLFSYPEHVTITDYKSSDIRDPAKARQRAKDSLQLSIYAMGYEATTGRLPDDVALHFLETGLVGRARVDRKRIDKARDAIRTAATGIRARRLRAPARPALVRLLRLPGDLPGQRRALTAMAPLDPSSRAALAAVLEGSARGAVLEADNLDVLAAIPDGAVDLAYADPPFATGTKQRLVSIRTGQGTQTRRGFRDREVAWEAVSDLSWDDGAAARPAPGGARGARPARSTGCSRRDGSFYLHVDWRTVHHVRLLLDDVFGAERFLNELVWAYDYGGRARDRWPRKHDTILWYAKGDTLAVRPRGDRPDPVPRAGARRAGEGGARQAAHRRVVDDDRPAGVRRAHRLPDPEAGAAPRADRGGVEPAGRPRARPVRGLGDDRRRGGAARAALAAGRSEPRGRRDRAGAARAGGRGADGGPS